MVRLNCGYAESVIMSLVSIFNVNIYDLNFAENVFRRIDGGDERAV